MSPPVAAAPVPCPPAASAKRNVPAPTRSASSERTKLIYAAYSLGAAPSKSNLNAFPPAKPLSLSWSCLGSLQTTSSPRRIDPEESRTLVQTTRCEAKMSGISTILNVGRTLTEGPLMPSHFFQAVKLDARACGASAVIGDD